MLKMAKQIKSKSKQSQFIDLDLSDNLKEERVVTDLFYNLADCLVTLEVNHEYDSKTVTSKLDPEHWTTHINEFEQAMRASGIIDVHTTLICDTLRDNHNKIRYHLDARLEAAAKAIAKTAQAQAQDSSRPKVYLRKYTANGTIPLHEAVLIQGQPCSFLSLSLMENENGRFQFQFVPSYEGATKVYCPVADTIDTQNPLPYIFESTEELNHYLELAKSTNLEELFALVDSIFRKYVNTEDHYITILVADIICSYFFDKFSTTHYNIFVGDNSSGKNSALLVFRWLGYRVFYGLSISAANYYTFLGDIEEGQGCIAEDEAQDIGYNLDKDKILKGGYCSGATVPKTDVSNGRKQDSWYTYSHKWYAMEELADYKRIKGILDRSLVHNFVIGNVQHNIKDVVKGAGDSTFKRLFDELLHARKLLFVFRMIRYNDSIPDIKLNIKHRNEELAKPLLRLFSYRNDSPIALEKIRLALSKFILGRNESKKNSIESKLYDAVKELQAERRNDNNNDISTTSFLKSDLPDYCFTNESIFGKVKELMEGQNIPHKDSAFYSVEYGQISYKQITMLYKSKLKAERFKKRVGEGDNIVIRRGLKFSKEWLDRLGLYYDVPEEIRFVTLVTDVTHYSGVEGSKNDILGYFDKEIHAQIASDKESENTKKYPPIPPETVTSVTTVTNQITSDIDDLRQELKDRDLKEEAR